MTKPPYHGTMAKLEQLRPFISNGALPLEHLMSVCSAAYMDGSKNTIDGLLEQWSQEKVTESLRQMRDHHRIKEAMQGQHREEFLLLIRGFVDILRAQLLSVLPKEV